MRFQKRIRIAKGLGLNLSKSGIGFSAGPRGFKLSAGPSGTWLSTGIPGTGLSHRSKLSGATSSHPSSSDEDSTNITVRVRANDDGSIAILSEFGSPIVDEALLRKIKRSDWYKSAVEKVSEALKNIVEGKTEQFIKIHELAPEIVSKQHWDDLLAEAKPDIYDIVPFPRTAPSLEEIKSILTIEAMSKFKSILFWKNERLRREYVEERAPIAFVEEMKQFNEAKASHEKEEAKKKEIFEKTSLEKYNENVAELKKAILGDARYIEKRLDEVLNDIELPAQFSIDYKLSIPELFVDLDLPEIEDIPSQKATILASGKASVKEKTGKELKEDYAECVTGMGFFFAATFFNLSPTIDKIVLSGYTQRTSKKTGKIEDQYVYSVAFTRDKFQELVIPQLVPYIAISGFEHRMNLTGTFELRQIDPLIET